ncbi:hypothetical protein TRFO_21852 [Tritrichomonas foetus]|uniref:Uncharacterized protein n=1 Tax=Tritrichomonas foetus TaxID=1144522 RepID=A0A1J4KIY9_9EUKA|nr:hypothetical protein TRFO_21852 [Tritrichomonas foetus]|eukprot:OHT09285.1 hypothetical protein TRFO_21852 [Tritrichomonas foetus]
MTESYKKSQFELNELRNDNQHIEKYKEDNEKLKKRLSDMNDLIEIEKSRILKEKDEDESEGNLEEEEEEEHQDYEDNDSGEE